MRCIIRGAVISLFLLASMRSGVSASPQSSQAEILQDSLVTAMEMVASELELAKMAQSYASHSKVKAMANSMIKDHQRDMKRLKELLAAPVGEVGPPFERLAAADHLYELSGSEFDLEFLNQTVAAYQASVGFFDIQSRGRDDKFAKIARDLKSQTMDHLFAAEALRHTLAVVVLAEKDDAEGSR